MVQHRTQHLPDLLPKVLGRRSTLPVKRAEPGEPILPGRVYLAPIEKHLVVQPDRTFAFRDGRRIRYVLSSANPLFTTAAEALGPVIGVVLTGKGADAPDGVQSIKAAGGIVIAQDQATAEHFEMPKSAIATGAVELVLPLEEIGPRLVKLSRGEQDSAVA